MVDATPKQSREFFNEIVSLGPTLVLTGAGISVSSGIPTYRDETGTWLRSDPIKHQEFVANPRQRQRYWGRSLRGWPGVRNARPTPAHEDLVQLEQSNAVHSVVTQNVDRLHQRAGADRVIDLHGRIDRVRCLECDDLIHREALQGYLAKLNPTIATTELEIRPDGDADLADSLVESIVVPDCASCGGTLMPDVVFFGGSIPGSRVERCKQALADAASLLVIGSSLQVYSGYRFCRWAERMEKPIFIVNPGNTRADSMARKLLPASADQATQTFLEVHSLKNHGRVLGTFA